MRIVLAPVGTRGDVQPFIALGRALRKRQHSVAVCAPANFQRWIDEQGLEFHPSSGDFRRLLDGTQSEQSVVRGVAAQAASQFKALLEVCRGADRLVGAMLQLAGPSIAQKLNIPYYYVVYTPCVLRSRAHPPAGVPFQQLPVWLNKTLWGIASLQWNRLVRSVVNRERSSIGLRPIQRVYEHLFYSGPLLVAVDPVLAPVPPDVGPHHVTGYWFLPEQEDMETDLKRFLAAGPPPIYVGFGSMRHTRPRRMTRKLIQAVGLSGQRALISMGWTGLGENAMPEHIKLIGEAPHSVLFPQVAAVVHHGGAGTTAVAAQAGIPQVVVPHFGDQWYFGHRIHQLGLGPKPIPQMIFTASHLGHAIKAAVEDVALRERAEALGKQIQKNDGVLEAIRVIENLL